VKNRKKKRELERRIGRQKRKAKRGVSKKRKVRALYIY
jgi:hypothetical protein